jgi:S-adenosylhomocysteine hydrolase
MISTRIDWVRDHCHLLQAISEEFRRTRPFQGLTIGTGHAVNGAPPGKLAGAAGTTTN